VKALVLSGGGSKGAFQVGVLRYLVDTENVDYDIYAGASVGALNCSQCACGPLKETLPELEDIWLHQVQGNHSIWNQHIWHYVLVGIITIVAFTIAGFMSFILDGPKWLTTIFAMLAVASLYIPYFSLNHTHSIYSTEPLRKLIETNLVVNKLRESGKILRVGAVSYTTGKYYSASGTDEQIVDWIMASSAFPVFFPPVEIGGQYWTDGGVTNIVPLSDALAAGATEIDIILCSPPEIDAAESLPGIPQQLMRDLDIMTTEIQRNDLTARLNGKDVKIRIFKPVSDLTSNSLSFDPTSIQNMYNEGKRVAEATLKAG
jgi:NTE family protein